MAMVCAYEPTLIRDDHERRAFVNHPIQAGKLHKNNTSASTLIKQTDQRQRKFSRNREIAVSPRSQNRPLLSDPWAPSEEQIANNGQTRRYEKETRITISIWLIKRTWVKKFNGPIERQQQRESVESSTIDR